MQGVIGDYGINGVNEGGEWMIDWCMQCEMTVCNTHSRMKYSQINAMGGK